MSGIGLLFGLFSGIIKFVLIIVLLIVFIVQVKNAMRKRKDSDVE